MSDTETKPRRGRPLERNTAPHATPNQRVGRMIRQARLNAGLSVEEACLKSGVSLTAWYRLEAGEVSRYDKRRLDIIAKTLGTETAKFFI